MSRPSPLLLALPLLLAACAAGNRLASEVGTADPLRDPARTAAFEFGDSANLAGNTTAAARAAAEVEAFAHAAETDPAWTHPRDATLLPRLQIARREFRAALGIPAAVPAPVAIRSLATAVDALQRYDQAAAVAALAPVGGAPVLDRLGRLPRLPRVEEALQAVAIEVNMPQLGN